MMVDKKFSKEIWSIYSNRFDVSYCRICATQAKPIQIKVLEIEDLDSFYLPNWKQSNVFINAEDAQMGKSLGATLLDYKLSRMGAYLIIHKSMEEGSLITEDFSGWEIAIEKIKSTLAKQQTPPQLMALAQGLAYFSTLPNLEA